MSILDKLNDFGTVELAGRQVPVAVLAIAGVAGVALIVRARGGASSDAGGSNTPGRNAQIDETAARTIAAIGNAQDFLAAKGETQTQGLLERLGILEGSLSSQNEAFANSLADTASALQGQLGQQGQALRDQIAGTQGSILDIIGNLADQINVGFATQYQNIDAVARANNEANRSLRDSLGTLWNSFNALFQQVNQTPATQPPPTNTPPATTPTPPPTVVTCTTPPFVYLGADGKCYDRPQ